MPDITLITHEGTAYGFEAPEGVSLMQAATGHGVPGMAADCGGSAMCATCHVLVPDDWLARLPPPDPHEHLLLDRTACIRERGSRLACQIRLDASLQGLVVRLPESQY